MTNVDRRKAELPVNVIAVALNNIIFVAHIGPVERAFVVLATGLN